MSDMKKQPVKVHSGQLDEGGKKRAGRSKEKSTTESGQASQAGSPARLNARTWLKPVLACLKSKGLQAAVDLLATLESPPGTPLIAVDQRLLLLAQIVQQTDPKTALVLAEQAASQDVANMEARLLAGIMHDRLGNRKSAEEATLEVVRSKHSSAEQVIRAANLLVRFGRQEIALKAAKHAYEKIGEPLRWASALLYIAQVTADWPLVQKLTSQIRNAYAQGIWNEVSESPRTNLLWCCDELINLQVVSRWSEKTLVRIPDVVCPAPSPLAGRKLRVGYLSSDFRDHPTARLVNGLFRHHDREKMEFFMYCSGWDDKSAMRREVESHFDHVHSVAQMSDEAAAFFIRSHQVDVLVELNGPTRANRMGILAYRPAPVQIDYLGWPGSVGGRVVDYVVGDRYTVSDTALKSYPEKVIRIEKIYQVNDYAAMTLLPKPDRKSVGLPSDPSVPVIGMFNAINKVHQEVWDTWMRIMKAVPKAILWLLDPGPAARKHIVAALRAESIDPSRIIIAPKLPQEKHLARLQCCDLMLDPWPYGGHTSTSDALFAGVPVIALRGENFAGLVSGGLLESAGLGALVQPDTNAYVEKAVQLLSNNGLLARLKQFISRHVRRSDVFNAASKARQLEAAFVHAYSLVIAGKPPEHINLKLRATSPMAIFSWQDEGDSPIVADGFGIESIAENTFRIPLVLVCGPWGGGTSAVAGLLANAGLQAPGPYVTVKDPRTPLTYEMKAFQRVLRSLASEKTLQKSCNDEQALAALKQFRDEVLLPVLDHRKGGVPVMLKHGLAALFIPQLRELFDLRLVGVLRPFDAIETTRLRRGWHAGMGRKGALAIYRAMFGELVGGSVPFHILRYSDLMNTPETQADRLLAFCGIHPTSEQRAAALASLSRPVDKLVAGGVP